MFKTEFENLRRTCPLIHNITNCLKNYNSTRSTRVEPIRSFLHSRSSLPMSAPKAPSFIILPTTSP